MSEIIRDRDWYFDAQGPFFDNRQGSLSDSVKTVVGQIGQKVNELALKVNKRKKPLDLNQRISIGNTSNPSRLKEQLNNPVAIPTRERAETEFVLFETKDFDGTNRQGWFDHEYDGFDGTVPVLDISIVEDAVTRTVREGLEKPVIVYWSQGNGKRPEMAAAEIVGIDRAAKTIRVESLKKGFHTSTINRKYGTAELSSPDGERSTRICVEITNEDFLPFQNL